MNPKRKSCAGATLAEALVVIAVILIFTTVLMPALQKQREMAASAQCLNNLRQIGLSFQAYAKDFDGCLPDSRLQYQNGDPNPYVPGANWIRTVAVPVDANHPNEVKRAGYAYPLRQYVEDLSVFTCPSDVTPQPTRKYTGSYELRHVMSNFMPSFVGTVRFSMAKRPSRLVYLYEVNNWHRNFGQPYIGAPDPPHETYPYLAADIGTQYCNALFMDGHVASWPVPANRYTGLGYAAYNRNWFYGDVNKDKGINSDNSGLWSLTDFYYTSGGQMLLCDPYDTLR